MKYSELKVGQYVWDRWYPEFGVGEIVKILKTRIHILFRRTGLQRYDKAHLQFLERDYEKTFMKPVGPWYSRSYWERRQKNFYP